MKLYYFTSIDLTNAEPGAKAHIENIILGLHKLKWKITLFSCSRFIDNPPDYPVKHKLVKKKNYSLTEQIFEQLRLAYILLVAGKHQADVIYIRYSPLLIVPVFFALIKKIPFYLEMNAAIEFFSSNKKLIPFALIFENWAFKKAHGIITTTSELQEYFSKRSGVLKQKISVLPMGYDSNLINYKHVLKQKSDRAFFIIGYLGQFHKRQGIENLVKAIPLVLKKYNNVLFKLAGSGQQEMEMKKLVQQLKIKTNVNFLGCLSKKEIPGFLSRCDLTVAPYFGGFNKKIPMGSPTKILAYLASNKPVVTTKLPSLKLFEDCKDVFFAEPENIEDLAEKIIQVLTLQVEEKSDVGIHGRNFVKEHFSWENLSRQTHELLIKN